MKRIPIAVAALVCALATAATPAASKTFELGSTAAAVTPSCSIANPTSCFVVTRTTTLQVRTADVAYPTTAPASGRIVAFTLQLGQLNTKQIHFFNSTYGGTARVQIAVLRQRPQRFFTLVAQSPIFRIQPFLGTTVQFPLETTLPVKKGDVVALTVPTWAPILALGLPSTNSWRASRASNCRDLVTLTAQSTIGGQAQYKCLYTGARLTYTATEISTPVPPKPPAVPKKKKTTK